MENKKKVKRDFSIVTMRVTKKEHRAIKRYMKANKINKISPFLRDLTLKTVGAERG